MGNHQTFLRNILILGLKLRYGLDEHPFTQTETAWLEAQEETKEKKPFV
jgi:hypothetical protein